MPAKARKSEKRARAGKRALVELEFPSETRYLHMVHQLTKHLAEATGFDGVESEKIALAVNEATTNVIQHAYSEKPGHAIEIHFDPGEESLDIVIYHEGKVLPSLPIPDFDLDKLVAEHSKGGLGLTIMRQMMDKVEHAKARGGKSKCVMVRYKQKSAGRK